MKFTGGGEVRANEIKTQQISPQSLRRIVVEEVERLNVAVEDFGGASRL